MPKYIIESTQVKQYWNEHGPVRGWLTCREDATEFTQEQRDAGGLPNRGCWVIVNEPDSQRRILDMSKPDQFILITERNSEGGLLERPRVTFGTVRGGGQVCEGYRSEYSVTQLKRMVTAVNAHSALVDVLRRFRSEGHAKSCECAVCIQGDAALALAESKS